VNRTVNVCPLGSGNHEKAASAVDGEFVADRRLTSDLGDLENMELCSVGVGVVQSIVADVYGDSDFAGVRLVLPLACRSADDLRGSAWQIDLAGRQLGWGE
jgi:hypothetical protein